MKCKNEGGTKLAPSQMRDGLLLFGRELPGDFFCNLRAEFGQNTVYDVCDSLGFGAGCRRCFRTLLCPRGHSHRRRFRRMRGLVIFILPIFRPPRLCIVSGRTASLTNLSPARPSGGCGSYQGRFFLLGRICQASYHRFAWCSSLCRDRDRLWLRFTRARLESVFHFVWKSLVLSARGLLLSLHGFGNAAACRN